MRYHYWLRLMFGFTLVGLILTGCEVPAATTVTPMPTLIPPTATSVSPTTTPVPPTVTAVEIKPTPAPPTATSVPPTSTPIPRTATSIPPTPTLIPATATRVPPTATRIPPTPTPASLENADWAVIAKTVSQSAKHYLPQMQEARAILATEPTNCSRLVQLLDSLAGAPRYPEVDGPLWQRRGRPGIEGELWTIKDAYTDGVNHFRLDIFGSIRNGCAGGTQPTAEQRQSAMQPVDYSIGKLEDTIRRLAPAVGP
jgi:hypothetical protein